MQTLAPTVSAPNEIASVVARVCRYDTANPGFALIDLGPKSDSRSLRQAMIEFCGALSGFHEEMTDRSLGYFWLGRFDQQATTKFHRDNAPQESILLLGYEPTNVVAKLSIADHSRAAERLGISPLDYLEQHNPMFPEGERLLSAVVTQIEDHAPSHFQILIINNSEAVPRSKKLVGLLHKAEIIKPDLSAPRVVNSIMLACPDYSDKPLLGDDAIHSFLETDEISRGGK